MQTVTLFGVRVHAADQASALTLALTPRKEPFVVVTPNAVMLEKCRRTPALAQLLNRADLALPDGAGVLMAARRAGTPLPARVAGIEFGEALIRQAAEEGLRVFLLGGRPGVAARAGEALRARYPKLFLCGAEHGYFQKSGEEDRAVTARIRAASPQILLVCFGFPSQEEWMLSHRAAFPGLGVMAGLGGSLDVWAGDCRRAPTWLSHMGLEWAFRMGLQPRRMKDLPTLVRFAWHASLPSNGGGEGREAER